MPPDRRSGPPPRSRANAHVAFDLARLRAPAAGAAIVLEERLGILGVGVDGHDLGWVGVYSRRARRFHGVIVFRATEALLPALAAGVRDDACGQNQGQP